MTHSIRAFSDDDFDYYELLQDLGDKVPKGAIFYLDPDEGFATTGKNYAGGFLKLCWTPDGKSYGCACGGAVVFAGFFKNSTMFRKVQTKADRKYQKVISLLEDCLAKIKTVVGDPGDTNK